MFKEIINTIKAHKSYRIIFVCFIVIAYTLIACIFSFGKSAYYFGNYFNDSLLQNSSETNSEIITIGISHDDLDYYGKTSEELIIDVLNKINDAPAAIGLDINVDSLSDESKNEIVSIGSKNNNLVLPINITLEDDTYIDDYDLASNGLNIKSISFVDENYVDAGFNLKVLDSNDILRHEIFSLDEYDSLNYVCYKKYCEANNIELNDFSLSSQNTALIKYSSNIGINYSARDILSGRVSVKSFKNKIVLVGETIKGSSLTYGVSNDYTSDSYSIEVDANVINCLIKNEFVLSINKYVQVLLYVMAIAVICIFVSLNGIFFSICSCILYEVAVVVGSNLLYGLGIIGLTFPHIINGAVTCLICILVKVLYRNNVEKKQLLDVVDKYVDINVKDLVDVDPKLLIKNDNVKSDKVTVLFADIRKFTTISENIKPDKLVKLLNEVLSMMADSIEKYGGTVDKFIGDCAMAYWQDYDNSAYRACLAAKEILRNCKQLEASIIKEYGVELKIGIGIDYGDAIIGVVGSNNRKNFTVVGDTVNTASRLEKYAPANTIIISESVKKQLANKATTNKIKDKIVLKGKLKPATVYSLQDLSAFSVSKVNEKEIDLTLVKNRGLSALALIANLLILIIQIIFVLNTLRTYGTLRFVYSNVGMCLVSIMSLVLLLPYDVNNYNSGTLLNVKPRFVNILMLSGMMANIYIGLNKLVALLNPEISIAGGFFLFVFCPDLCIFSYLVLEKFRKYAINDLLYATIPLIVVMTIDLLSCLYFGYDTEYALMFNVYYDVLHIFLFIIADLLISFVLIKLDDHVNLQGKLINVKFDFISRLDLKIKNTRFYNFIIKRTNLILFNILLNIILAALSIRATIKASLAGGVSFYSNPSLIGIVVFVTCIISIVIDILKIINPNKIYNIRLYKYFSLAKTLGCQINFFSVLVLAISGEGIGIFFSHKWNADWTIFLLCPLLSLMMWIYEKNNYNTIYKCLLTSIPYVLIMFLSKIAINSAYASRDYSYELSNFYSADKMILIIAAEIGLSIFYAYVSRIIARLIEINKSSKDIVYLNVCGTRTGENHIKRSKYGKYTQSYVIRDEDYGLIINAGTGLVNAVDDLVGCKDVDIIITSNTVDCLWGFKLAQNLCPDAKIRVISPFKEEDLLIRPSWPLNEIKGYCETVKVGKKFRLNNLYSFYFTENGSESDYLVKIYGLINVCVSGNFVLNESIKKYFNNCDLIICNNLDDISGACYLTYESNSSHILFAGYGSNMKDAEISELEKNMKKIIVEGDFTIENMAYKIK